MTVFSAIKKNLGLDKCKFGASKNHQNTPFLVETPPCLVPSASVFFSAASSSHTLVVVVVVVVDVDVDVDVDVVVVVVVVVVCHRLHRRGPDHGGDPRLLRPARHPGARYLVFPLFSLCLPYSSFAVLRSTRSTACPNAPELARGLPTIPSSGARVGLQCRAWRLW